MSLLGNRRARIPVAFMSLQWKEPRVADEDIENHPISSTGEITPRASSFAFEDDCSTPTVTDPIPKQYALDTPVSKKKKGEGFGREVGNRIDGGISNGGEIGKKKTKLRPKAKRNASSSPAVPPSGARGLLDAFTPPVLDDKDEDSSSDESEVVTPPGPTRIISNPSLHLKKKSEDAHDDIHDPDSPTTPTSATFITQSEPSPSTTSSPQTAAASLRSIRSNLRRLKERRLSGKTETNNDESRRGLLSNFKLDPRDEELVERLDGNHKEVMTQLSAMEERAYEGRWAKLAHLPNILVNDNTPSTRHEEYNQGLKFHQVPWPLTAPVIFSLAEITQRNVEGFLLSPFKPGSVSARRRIQVEMKRWEEEAFENILVDKVSRQDKETVREGRMRVWKVLQDIWKGLA